MQLQLLLLLLNEQFPQWKLASAGLFALMVAAADVVTEAKAWEDLGMKALLLIALGIVGKLYLDREKLMLKQQLTHQQELKELRDQHERRLETVIKENTASNQQVVASAQEQLLYFKAVTRSVVNEKLGQKETPNIP